MSTFNIPNTLRLAPTLIWQQPAFTEKQAAFNHQNLYLRKDDQLYVECPWATLLDYVQRMFSTQRESLLTNSDARKFIFNLIDIDYFNPIISSQESHTVCQHIRWMDLVELWKILGIKNAHISHLKNDDINKCSGLNLRAWHLIAPNAEHPNRNKGLEFKKTDDKKYLCSFIGNWKKSYLTDTRSKLSKIKNHNNDVYFETKEGQWFFKKIVYDNQVYNSPINNKEIEKIQNETAHYNQILSDSVFSICPDGAGPNTLRLWESMSIGSIPVIFKSDWVKPTIKNLKWEDFSISLDAQEIDSMIDILRSIPKDNIENMKINCVNAYNQFRSKTCF